MRRMCSVGTQSEAFGGGADTTYKALERLESASSLTDFKVSDSFYRSTVVLMIIQASPHPVGKAPVLWNYLPRQEVGCKNSEQTAPPP